MPYPGMFKQAILLAILVCLVGCATAPAPDSGYLENPDRMTEQRDRAPFNRVWVSDEWRANRDSYRKIVVAWVNTDYLIEEDWWKSQNLKTRRQLEKDRKAIARHLRQAVVDAFYNDENKRLQVVDKFAPNTFILEMALVELVPAKAFFNTAATVGGFLMPGVGLAKVAGKGSVAIEGRIRDSNSGRILASFADREVDKSAPIDIASMMWYQGSKNNIDDWADQFVELMNTPRNQQVPDSMPFRLKPW